MSNIFENTATENPENQYIHSDDQDFLRDSLQKMQKARSELLLSHPFFGSLSLKLELKADRNCVDLWTDGKTLAYNPHFVSVLSNEHLVGAQAHEILHLACGHNIRRKGRDEKLWNKACDYAVNSILLEAGFSLPKHFLLTDKKYADMSVDDIYVDLKKLHDQDVHGGAKNENVAEQTDKTNGASSAGSSNNEEKGSIVDQKSQNQKNQNDNNDNKEEKSQKTESLSKEGQAKKGSQKTQASTSSFGEVKDHPLLSQENNERAQKKAEQESMMNLSQALQSSENMGDLPLGLLRLCKEILRPQLDWTTLLQRFIENCNDGDYTWSSPNRRYISQNIYLPSRKEAKIPTIALAIDASGSVDEQLLNLFCSELENILESYDTNLCVLYHDTKVHNHKFYSREDRPLMLSPTGGGGTSYKHIPKYLDEESVEPTCLLWFTDFECNAYPEEPPYPVLWVSTKKSKQTPPFGEVIFMNN